MCGVCSDWFLLRLHWRADHRQGRPGTASAGDQAAPERHQLGCLCHRGESFLSGLFNAVAFVILKWPHNHQLVICCDAA